MKTRIYDFYPGAIKFEKEFEKELIERYEEIVKKCKKKKIIRNDVAIEYFPEENRFYVISYYYDEDSKEWRELERIDPENDKEFE